MSIQTTQKQLGLNDRHRIDTFDICKGICIMMVILGHQLQKCGLVHPLQFIQTFHMPLFFMISGYFISDTASLPDFTKKRARRLLIPYAICCTIAIIISALRAVRNHSTLSNIGKEILRWLWISIYASGSDHGSKIGNFGYDSEIGIIWYLVALFWASIVVKYLINKPLPMVSVIFVASIGIGTSTLLGWLPFSIQNGLGTTFWVFIGYTVKHYNLLERINNYIYSKWILLIIPVWLISALFGCVHLYENYYALGLVDIVGCIAGSLLVYGLCISISKHTNYAKHALSWIGKNSLLIYCLHFVEDRLSPISSHLADSGIENKVVYALLCWVMVSILTIGAAAILSRFRIVRKVF